VSGAAVIGYVVLTLGYSLEYLGRDAFVDELYVRQTYRRQGVGTHAIEHVVRTCRELDVRALHLEVERHNAPAQALYRKVGFRDRDHYLMTRRLDE
jgi:ribosomal protein S18 acetylase RimI-like enzyme